MLIESKHILQQRPAPPNNYLVLSSRSTSASNLLNVKYCMELMGDSCGECLGCTGNTSGEGEEARGGIADRTQIVSKGILGKLQQEEHRAQCIWYLQES